MAMQYPQQEPIDYRLIELSRQNHIIYAFATRYIRGELSLVGFLTECVIALADVNKKQFEELVRVEENKPIPSFFKKG